MSRVIVAFESEAVSQRICELLSSASVPVRAVCHTGAEVIRQVRYMGGGVVVTAAKLTDMTADYLYDDLDGLANLLVVGKPQQLAMCEHPRVFRLPLPVNRYDLAASVSMLLQLDEMESRRSRPGKQEQARIDQAKRLLQTHEGMSEPEAHRYMQRQCMNAGVRMAEFAEKIIAGYSKEG